MGIGNWDGNGAQSRKQEEGNGKEVGEHVYSVSELGLGTRTG